MKKTNFIKTLIVSTIMMGVFAMPLFAADYGWTTDGSDWFYYEANGAIATETIKSSGDDKYYLNQYGFMVRDYLLEDYNESVYYFDDTGKMVKNTWVAVDPTQVSNGMDNAPTVYLYYFGSNGKAYKSKSGVVRRSIDGKKYMFNENGQMLSGWINEQGERYSIFDSPEDDPFVGYCYYAGDETDGVLREGWSAYEDGSVADHYYKKETLWFYFKPGDNKKVCADNSSELVKRTINGHTYGFDENGVMIQGWDSDMMDNLDTTNLYFDEVGENIGRMNKKEWIFAVPSEKQNATDHDEEISQWFYANSSGDIVKDEMRKINGNFYVFNNQGIMKKGLCIIDLATRGFKDCIDLERTDGADFIVSRRYISYERYNSVSGGASSTTSYDVYDLFDNKTQRLYYFNNNEEDTTYGQRKIGNVLVAFADDDYTFTSTGLGQREGLFKKKYYQAGLQLKADKALGLGLVFLGNASESEASGVSYEPQYNYEGLTPPVYAHRDKYHEKVNAGVSDYVYTDYVVDFDYTVCNTIKAWPVFAVVDAVGNKINKSYITKKDKSGHYWLIGANGSFIKAFNVPIKYNKALNRWEYKSEKTQPNGRAKTDWIPFMDYVGTTTAEQEKAIDVYGKTCWASRDIGVDPVSNLSEYNKRTAYEVPLDDVYATNFRFVEHAGSDK